MESFANLLFIFWKSKLVLMRNNDLPLIILNSKEIDQFLNNIPSVVNFLKDKLASVGAIDDLLPH